MTTKSKFQWNRYCQMSSMLMVFFFQSPCDNTHTNCEECEFIFKIFQKFQMALNDYDGDNKEEIIFDFNQDKNKILEWQKHLIRANQQDKSKTEVLRNLKNNQAMLLRDWMMKYIPTQYREKASDWFGKRGISNEIYILISKSGDEFEKSSYFVFHDQVKQDANASLIDLEVVVKQLQNDFPHITEIYERSDNAQCYSASSSIILKPIICKKSGIKLIASHNSEVQNGKDQCDR